MATSYDVIHQRALMKLTDHSILEYADCHREAILDAFLLSAIVSFSPICKIDLSDRDEEARQFNANLTDEVIEILATGEAYYWVLPRVNSEENMFNILNTKDYKFASPANLLKELRSLGEGLKKDMDDKIVMYSYRHGDIVSLKP